MDISIAVLTASVGALLAVVTALLGKRQKTAQAAARKAFERGREEEAARVLATLVASFVDKAVGDLFLSGLAVSSEPGATVSLSDVQRESIEKQVQHRTAALRERVERIEERFPEESTLEKLSSVNDAILATRIEDLQASLERIENGMLSKWDVAKIVFAMIGALGALVGVTIAIITFVAQNGAAPAATGAGG